MDDFTLARYLKYTEGSVIAEEGNTRHIFMVFVLEGNVAAYRKYNTPEQERIALAVPGDFFGDESLFLSAPPSATLVAASNAKVVLVEPQNARAYFAHNPQKAFDVMTRLCVKLANATKNYNTLVNHLTHGKSVPIPAPPPPPPPSMPSETAKPAAPGKPAAPEKPAAPPPVPENKPAAPVVLAPASSLFPEGHRSDYVLKMNNDDKNFLSQREMECPLCHNRFKYLKVRSSKLMVEKNDFDLRVFYKGVEPMYYDLVSCPKCLYSALCEIFPKAMSSRRKRVEALIDPVRGDLTGLTFGQSLNTPAVFAGYYLALLCAPVCFSDHEMITAGLWLKLSRIYDDCEDAAMLSYTAEKAQKAYIDAFSRLNIDPAKAAQLYLTIGALSIKIGDIASAKNFLYKAKTDKQSPPAIREKADILIEDLRTHK